MYQFFLRIRHASVILLMLLLTNNIHSQAFEGKIRFMKESLSDTMNYIYYIKGDKVRIEEYDRIGKMSHYLIADLSENKIIAINPKRKLYMDVQIRPYIEQKDSNYVVIKSPNYKNINGYECHQWRVRNSNKNTEIAFWVVNDNFDFFQRLLQLLNRAEKNSEYFLQIDNAIGYFPLLVEERSLLRDYRMRYEVTEIDKRELQTSIFDIPKNYKLFER